MSSKDMKDLRKQLRSVVKDILPEVLASELVDVISKAVDAKLAELEATMMKNLNEMHARQKDTLGYLVRQVSKPSDKS